ncbi:hypothetical protein K461DRAFT_262741 [Myriangium duriaei CBS 260.36]|uniref:BZIP domain-containing protein n=1 Tax=Myriangium duriaei CBS 260.36 TaxID=1168546 RepID=A0A9P4IXB1_9PEZI|nr:hypothetical protein K461DRAFT_262741 [Myriangium duriaei CBS 260.36]
MATAQFAHMGAAPNMIKSDLDMTTYFDFDQSLANRTNSRTSARAGSSKTQVYQDNEEQQVFAGPSHEYDRFPQQTGVVAGDVRNLANINPQFGGLGGFNSGIDESAFGAWDVDSDFNMDMSNPSMFDKFVDPSFIEAEEPQSNVGRLWPGMHQQAALAKSQQAPQQINQQGKGKARAGQPTDPHTEESISRLLSQMRQQNNHLSSVPEEDDDGMTPSMSGMGRMRKDEEDMDDDERLLASEEGKKLSSKERRQLRNKVSARAFRSRRKEYIGQLEGEVAQKAQENTTLKTENTALSEENARYRALIETLLRHPSFTPFIEDLSKDPAFVASQQQLSVPQTQSRRSMTPAQPKPQPQQVHHRMSVNMPETPVDLSMLNINNNASFAQQNMNFDFAQAQMFANQGFSQASMDQSRQGSFF